jgi:hypothetical protein
MWPANWTAQWFSPNGAYSSDEIADAYADIVANGLLMQPVHSLVSPPNGADSPRNM